MYVASTQGKLEKPWNLKPAPMAPKVTKKCPRGHRKKHEKWSLISLEFNSCKTWFVQYFPLKNCFRSPRHPDVETKTATKGDLKTSPNNKKNGAQTTVKLGLPNRPKIIRISIPDPYIPGCPQGTKVIPQVQKRKMQAPQTTVLGIKNHHDALARK